MLDIRLIREQHQMVRKAIVNKQLGETLKSLDELLQVDEEMQLVRQDLEEKQAVRNAESRRIGELKRQGESADDLIRRMGTLSDEVKRLEEKQRSLENHFDSLMLEIPNLPHESVPYGASEHDNVVVKEWGERPQFSFSAKPHWDLAKAREWIDLERGVKLAGAGFPVFKGDGAKLFRALIQLSLNRLVDEGYTEIAGPLMVNEASATATAQLPDKEGQMYEVTDGFYLIPTSELILTNLHRDEILNEDSLPLKYTGYTPCFRREAGSYGAHVRGINRVHQFDKVEMVQFTHADASHEALDKMVATAESLLEDFGLPYRRLLMCTGDMGFSQHKKFDIEVWSAGQQRWLEVSSLSNISDFQARRLKTRYRVGGQQGKGRPELVHTLNGSLFGMVRLAAAIMENYQLEDGTVGIPEVLRPYFGSDTMT